MLVLAVLAEPVVQAQRGLSVPWPALMAVLVVMAATAALAVPAEPAVQVA